MKAVIEVIANDEKSALREMDQLFGKMIYKVKSRFVIGMTFLGDSNLSLMEFRVAVNIKNVNNIKSKLDKITMYNWWPYDQYIKEHSDLLIDSENINKILEFCSPTSIEHIIKETTPKTNEHTKSLISHHIMRLIKETRFQNNDLILKYLRFTMNSSHAEEKGTKRDIMKLIPHIDKTIINDVISMIDSNTPIEAKIALSKHRETLNPEPFKL